MCVCKHCRGYDRHRKHNHRQPHSCYLRPSDCRVLMEGVYKTISNIDYVIIVDDSTFVHRLPQHDLPRSRRCDEEFIFIMRLICVLDTKRHFQRIQRHTERACQMSDPSADILVPSLLAKHRITNHFASYSEASLHLHFPIGLLLHSMKHQARQALRVKRSLDRDL